jgi:hypothetical protein
MNREELIAKLKKYEWNDVEFKKLSAASRRMHTKAYPRLPIRQAATLYSAFRITGGRLTL